MVRGIAVFDLDGTLLRGDTVCELLARPLARLPEMKRFERLTEEAEIANARKQMALWYDGVSVETLHSYLDDAIWAPGAREAIRELQRGNILVAIASITWRFAVGWFASQLSVRHYLGTDINEDGSIAHVWPRDKARWLNELVRDYEVSSNQVAAIGDSWGDTDMLMAAHLSFFVGHTPLPGLSSAIHLPHGDLRAISKRILDAWHPDRFA